MEEKTRITDLSTHKKYQRSRLDKVYSRTFVEDFYLKKGVSCQNTHLFPRLKKLVVNKSSKDFVRERLEILPSSLSLLFLTGQRSQRRLALKSIAGFKLREKQFIGCKATLRGNKSLDLLEKVTQLVLPLSRDFSGLLTTSFDSYGNISLGCKESLLFPELSDNFEFFERVGGFDLCFSISSTSRKTSLSKKPNPLDRNLPLPKPCVKQDLAEEGVGFLENLQKVAKHKKEGLETTLAESVLFCTAMQFPLS